MALSLKKRSASEAPEGGKSSRRGEGRSSSTKTGKVKKAKGKAFVLIIGDEGAILIFMHGSKVVRRLFAPSAQPSHSEAMLEIMKANPTVPLSILADVLDQQYVPHAFPPVSAMSVGGLVKRRLDRDFQPEDLKNALRLGRDKTGRKEWKYLLVALVKTPLITDWLDVLLELPNQLKGIYLTPIEAANYVAVLQRSLSGASPNPWQLLISHNKVSGFRQVVMHQGKLVFTRVSVAIDDAIPAVIAGNIEQEIINTMEYLKRLEFRENSELDATVIVSQDVIDSLDLRRFNFGNVEILTPIAVSEALKLEQAALSADRFGDVVMAAALGISKKRNLRFANAYIEKLDKLYAANKALRAFAGLCGAGLLGLAAWALVGVAGHYGEIADFESKAKAQQGGLTKLQKSVEALGIDVASKSTVVAAYDSYLKDQIKPQDFALAIAPLLSQQQRVVELIWNNRGEVGRDKEAPVAATPAAGVPPAAEEKLPVNATITVDFSGAGGSIDMVNKTANGFIDALKTRLAQYEMQTGPFPWKKDEAKSEEVALETLSPSTVKVEDARVKVFLRGVKKSPAAAAAPPVPTMPGQP